MKATALAIVVGLASAAAAAPTPTIWEEATETPDAAAARTAYDAQMLAGDDLIAIAVASDRLDERGRLVQAAYNASTGLDADRQTVFNDVQQLLPGEAMEVQTVRC